MHGTHLRCGTLLLALAMAGPGLAAEPATSRDSGVSIGVLGAVAYPGAYEFEASEVDLETALRAAGGVRADAAETVRVVRAGEVRLTGSHLREKGLPLRSNDFVFVETLRPGAERSNVYLPHELRPGAQQESRPGGLYFGLANVTDWPVVMQIPAESATVLDIVLALGQPPEVLGSVRLIPLAPSGSSQSAASHLPADSLLVFDRSLIQASRLPQFPPPIQISQPSVAGPPILVVPPKATAKLEADVQTPAAPIVQAAAAEVTSIESPADEVMLVEVMSEAEPPIPASPATTEESGADRALVDWRLALLAAGAIVVLAMSLRMRPHPRPVRQSIGKLEPVMLPIIEAPQKPQLLSALIDDRLPVFEEPCRLPATLEFFGRPAALAAGRPELPVVPAEVGPPHFARVASGQPMSGRGDLQRAEVEAAAEVGGESRRADASHALDPVHRPHSVPQIDGQPSVLDRILTRLDKEARA